MKRDQKYSLLSYVGKKKDGFDPITKNFTRFGTEIALTLQTALQIVLPL